MNAILCETKFLASRCHAGVGMKHYAYKSNSVNSLMYITGAVRKTTRPTKIEKIAVVRRRFCL